MEWKKLNYVISREIFDAVGDTAPFVRAQTGLPLQAEERGFLSGGPKKSAPVKKKFDGERPKEGP